MKKSIYTILITFFILSCSNQPQQVVYEDDSEKINLYSKNLQLDEDEVILKYPYRIKKVDNLLLIWDLHGRDNFFHVFRLDDSTKYLYSFGKIGHGPEEFTNCAGMNVKNGHLSVIETNKAILYSYPIENLKREIGKPSKIVDLPKELVPIIKFADMGDEGKIILASQGESRFFLLGNNGSIIDQLYTIPNQENKDLVKPLLQQIWTGCLDYNPNNNILAIGTTLGEVLEIYNLKNKTSEILVGKQGEPLILHKQGRMSIVSAYGYQEIIVGDTEIYALYSNITHEEVEEAEMQKSSTPNGGNLIYVFDLEGNKKKTFILDQFINGFDIDFTNGIIYGVTSNSDVQLCIFSMPPFR